jgi:acyl-CoA thioesterase-1
MKTGDPIRQRVVRIQHGSGPVRRVRHRLLPLLAVVSLTVVACGTPRTGEPPAGPDPASAASPVPSEPRVPAVADARPRVVVLGDSLTAGYGLNPSDAFPSQLQRRIDAAGLTFAVVNMGVSGDTSAGGLRRLEWALEGDVRVLVIALGGNDGLRGLSPEDLGRNLDAMIDAAQRRGIAVLLCGMEAPPNFGAPYTAAFREVYHSVAREKSVVLLPFLLEGVAGVPSLNQADGIHPTAEGARRVADLVWTRLEPMLDARGTR